MKYSFEVSNTEPSKLDIDGLFCIRFSKDPVLLLSSVFKTGNSQFSSPVPTSILEIPSTELALYSRPWYHYPLGQGIEVVGVGQGID